jgi:hypothetical protein
LKITANGSALVDWTNGGKYVAELHDALADFTAALSGPQEYRLVAWQGTNEAKQVTEDAALRWSEDYRELHADIETVLGQELHPIMPLEWTGIRGALWMTR